MKILDCLTSAIQDLKNAGIESAALDARILLEYCLNIPREKLFDKYSDLLPDNYAAEYMALIARRKNHEPVSHITGQKEFWGLNFMTSGDTLDPRPDSEALIEAVLEHFPDKAAPYHILDLGTGTGCLILSLLHEYRNATGVGIDISKEALKIAQENADNLKLSDRVKFLNGGWNILPSLCGEKKIDIIISNPPYIKSSDISGLQPEVRNFDPHIALDGGIDGLDSYREIAKALSDVRFWLPSEVLDSKYHMSNEGLKISNEKPGTNYTAGHHLPPAGNLMFQRPAIFLEIGQNMEHSVSGIIIRNNMQLIETKKDLSGIARCQVFCHCPGLPKNKKGSSKIIR